jgi:hypothetical protein
LRFRAPLQRNAIEYQMLVLNYSLQQ